MSRSVLVVVGTGGMGVAIARRQGGGRRVLLADADATALDARVDALDGEGFDVSGHPVDVASADSLRALAEHASGLGAVDQVVHTAGLSPVQASAEAILRVDLLGVALSLDVFGEVIAPGGAGVVIASMAGHMFGPLPADQAAALAATAAEDLLGLGFLQGDVASNPALAYGIAKQANHIRVRAAARSWGARGARINSISPGVIATAMGRQELAGASGETMRSMIEGSGTGRVGTASDIAAAAAFLLGPESSFVTGTDLLVDGGVVASLTAQG
ncbi:MAG TPA: short-chain dehydrogenase [Gordonia polyisoprenivorans]|uniref:SDR family oxidoreductase n=1 Tax=Gordonia polyisoprenivorans TaxID=84595 RepID=UPI000EBBEB50|nr:SDR family oxidoreductase [Gordonia polyisoprenivorans]UZF54131.1 SDR family oxidoreductase [Gordonia polyisoprenivorans]WCB35376.1 SDR family oxidoreductase [Gordonia polyisoprenivorans]HCS56924.1 short-chain dehydrogenase [Gordonia polyisoprenivorans]